MPDNVLPNAPVSPEDAAQSFEKIEFFLRDLIPDGHLDVADVTGGNHRLRTMISAAAETRVIRKFNNIRKRLSEDEDGRDILSRAGGAPAGGAAGMISLLVDAAGEDILTEALGEVFEFMHHRAVKNAIESVKSDVDLCEDMLHMAGLSRVSELRAHHVFDRKELVRGCAPFVATVGLQILETMQTASEAMGTAA